MPVYAGTGSGAAEVSHIPGVSAIYAGTGTGTAEVWVDYRESAHVFDLSGIRWLDIPSWARWAQVVVLGGGGGGSGGDSALNRRGNGGKAGTWHSGTLGLSGATQVKITVGSGGSAGPKDKTGTNGGASSATVSGYTVTAPGGAAGAHASQSGDSLGQSPGNYTAFGQTFVGGGQAGLQAAGSPPGGGGGQGRGGIFGNGTAGGPGAPGRVWVFLYSRL